jgi:hypothetical protein
MSASKKDTDLFFLNLMYKYEIDNLFYGLPKYHFKW